MLECFDSDFFKMTEGFIAIIVFALVGFFILSYVNQNEQLEGIVVATFEAIIK